jgi:hypothetical protein
MNIGGRPYSAALHLGNIPDDLPPIILKGATQHEPDIGVTCRGFSFRAFEYHVPAFETLGFFVEGMRTSDIQDFHEAEVWLEFIGLSGEVSSTKPDIKPVIHDRVECKGDYRLRN